jgi:TetR/AcrR family transcriptional regulator, tetracycline repressor protein
MQLHRQDVLAGALAVLDAEGLEGLTMRKLAAQLGVQAGALYWHFKHKQALIDAIADTLLAGVDAPPVPGSWEEQLTGLCRRLRLALLAHRDGARVMAGSFTTEPNTLRLGALAVDLLRAAGLPAERAGWAGFAVGYYVLGHCIEEQAQVELAAEGGWEAKAAGVTGHDGSYFDQAMTATVRSDPAARFDYGLRLLVDGIRAQLPSEGPGPRPGGAGS